MKHKLRKLIALALCAAILSGCSFKNKENEGDTEASASVQAEAQPAAETEAQPAAPAETQTEAQPASETTTTTTAAATTTTTTAAAPAETTTSRSGSSIFAAAETAANTTAAATSSSPSLFANAENTGNSGGSVFSSDELSANEEKKYGSGTMYLDGTALECSGAGYTSDVGQIAFAMSYEQGAESISLLIAVDTSRCASGASFNNKDFINGYGENIIIYTAVMDENTSETLSPVFDETCMSNITFIIDEYKSGSPAKVRAGADINSALFGKTIRLECDVQCDYIDPALLDDGSSSSTGSTGGYTGGGYTGGGYTGGGYSGGSTTSGRRCMMCYGTGVCHGCNGTGYFSTVADPPILCSSCHQTGICAVCKGNGYV